MSHKEDDESGSGGQGGKSGSIQYEDFLMRDGKLSPVEEKRKLAEHQGIHASLTDKQKERADSLKDAKQGNTAGYQLGNAASAGGDLKFETHPLIGHKQQFDGMEPKVNPDPNRYDADTNPDKQAELTYQNQLRLGLQSQPGFNPPQLKP